jgi:hypothetical protein
MSFNIKQRLLLKSKLKDFKSFTKKGELGRGYQGTVYKYCKKGNKLCVAVKKLYLDEDETKFVKDPLKKRLFKFGSFIELASMQLTNELVLQNISPNFVLNYSYSFKEHTGICSEDYPYKMYVYNEYISDAMTFTDWIKQYHDLPFYYNAYFQITVALYTLLKYFNMKHLDLHSGNILVKKITPGGYWKYIINDTTYYVPNLGYIFLINDFGQAWIPNNFKVWFTSLRKPRQSYDIQHLFNSTLDFSTSPPEFKTQIRKLIRKLSKNEHFKDIIRDFWYDMYKTKPSSKLLDTFNMNKSLVKTNIPKNLQHLAIF